jgi:predicted permease
MIITNLLQTHWKPRNGSGFAQGSGDHLLREMWRSYLARSPQLFQRILIVASKMVNYARVIQVGAAIIVMIAVGFILAKTRIVPGSQFDPINRFLFKCCFISLVFRNLYRQILSTLNFMPLVVFICATGLAQLLLALPSLCVRQDKFQYYLATMLPSTSVNYIIIGLPIFNSIWGEENNAIVTIITMSNDLLTAPIYLFLTGIYGVMERNRIHAAGDEPLEKFSPKILAQIGMSMIVNPIIIGYIIGFAWAGLKLPIPLFIEEILQNLAVTCLPMSCLCIGGFLAQNSLIACQWSQFVIGLVTRHIVCPLLVALSAGLFRFTGTEARQSIIMATLPSAVVSYLMSSNSGVGTGVASTMIFWTNMLFLPAVIAWFVVLDALGLFVEEG